MSKFGSMRKQHVKADDTAEYPLYQIELNGKSPTLLVRPATEVNKPYFNALLKRSARAARMARAGKIDAATLARNRDEDRQLYPELVVYGWKDVIGDDGKAVAFTRDDCAEFLGALDDWVFDDVRNFCGDPVSFRKEDQPMPPAADEVEALGKN